MQEVDARLELELSPALVHSEQGEEYGRISQIALRVE